MAIVKRHKGFNIRRTESVRTRFRVPQNAVHEVLKVSRTLSVDNGIISFKPRFSTVQEAISFIDTLPDG